jgi:hypothetical protein
MTDAKQTPKPAATGTGTVLHENMKAAQTPAAALKDAAPAAQPGATAAIVAQPLAPAPGASEPAALAGGATQPPAATPSAAGAKSQEAIFITAKIKMYEASSRIHFPAGKPVQVYTLTDWLQSQIDAGLMIRS